MGSSRDYAPHFSDKSQPAIPAERELTHDEVVALKDRLSRPECAELIGAICTEVVFAGITSGLRKEVLNSKHVGGETVVHVIGRTKRIANEIAVMSAKVADAVHMPGDEWPESEILSPGLVAEMADFIESQREVDRG